MICAIVLAAGRSRRMGTQKLLLPIAGKPIIARVVDELRQSSVTATLVVTGADGKEIQQALSGRDVSFINNPAADGDMLSSIRCGLRALPSGYKAALIALGDQPNLTSELVAKLIAGFIESGRGIILPTHQDHRGHPVLMTRKLCEKLTSHHYDAGLREFLDTHPGEVFRVEISDNAALQDMDTPEDYQRHLSYSRP